MSLSCSCSEDGDRWHYGPQDYSPLATKRSRKCVSCGSRIAVGDLSVRFERARIPNNDIEERIYGDEVAMPPAFMCERCGDLCNSLDELGFCINLGDDMRELVKEYAEVYGRKP